MLSHTSGASGWMVGSASSQSVALTTWPTGAHRSVFGGPAGSPWPSPSVSGYHGPPPPSSMIPEQSLSIPSHASVAPGYVTALLSSQSVASMA